MSRTFEKDPAVHGRSAAWVPCTMLSAELQIPRPCGLRFYYRTGALVACHMLTLLGSCGVCMPCLSPPRSSRALAATGAAGSGPPLQVQGPGKYLAGIGPAGARPGWCRSGRLRPLGPLHVTSPPAGDPRRSPGEKSGRSMLSTVTVRCAPGRRGRGAAAGAGTSMGGQANLAKVPRGGPGPAAPQP